VIAEQRELRRETRMSARRARREAYHRDLEAPLRYAVRDVDGRLSAVLGPISCPVGYRWRAMGTHETLAHARRRLGWT
jgi:hypothetical protein